MGIKHNKHFIDLNTETIPTDINPISNEIIMNELQKVREENAELKELILNLTNSGKKSTKSSSNTIK